jgi:serine/threonine protein kinase
VAGPPSFDTCTRDVYALDQRFTLHTALALAAGMAAVGAHLHEQGILHGDLYAHNILWNTQGHGLLGDFGAASLLPMHDAAQALALTQLEVRALGCLLEELIERVQPSEGTCQAAEAEAEALAALQALQQQCCQTQVERRPSMANIASTLQALLASLR